jgi:TadE-like protein
MKGELNRGQSLAEMALMLPVLVALLLISLDFARLYYLSIEVTDAARAGAQFGSANGAAAANTLGMENAACSSMADVSCTAGVNTTASNFCQCAGSSATISCTSPRILYCGAELRHGNGHRNIQDRRLVSGNTQLGAGQGHHDNAGSVAN